MVRTITLGASPRQEMRTRSSRPRLTPLPWLRLRLRLRLLGPLQVHLAVKVAAVKVAVAGTQTFSCWLTNAMTADVTVTGKPQMQFVTSCATWVFRLMIKANAGLVLVVAARSSEEPLHTKEEEEALVVEKEDSAAEAGTVTGPEVKIVADRWMNVL